MEIEVSCHPARERCHAEALPRVEPAPSVLPLEQIPVQRGATWAVERWTTRGGRVVADTAPVSVSVSCTASAGPEYTQVVVPWMPDQYGYAVAPTARWVMRPRYVAASALEVEAVAPCVGSTAIDARHSARLLMSDETSAPMYSYRSGKRWIASSAVLLEDGASLAFPAQADKPFAALVVGTFSRPRGEAAAILRLGGDEEPALVVRADVDDTVLLYGTLAGEPLSARSMLGSGSLTALLAWSDGQTCGVWTASYGRAPPGGTVMGSGVSSTSSECSIGGYGRGCVVVEAAMWSGGFDVGALRAQIGALLSYYNSRRP